MKRKGSDFADRIVRDPEILTGKPTVNGTRISVELVLGFLAENPNLKDLFRGYPDLTVEDVQACLAFAEEQVRKSHKYRPTKKPKDISSAVA
jgi:uncharacterized protein (DUF433 family)